MIIVHIAAVPTETEQRCLRCHAVLIDLRNTVTVGTGTIQVSHWQPGGFVGVLETNDPEKVDMLGKPRHSFAMSRDAMESDEIKCGEGGKA